MPAPDVVVVGAATRDLNDADPRGWVLGGGVTFGALAMARMGLRTGVVVGLDPAAREARELDLIRASGAEVVTVPLEHGPVYLNVETPSGRVQTCVSTSDPVPASAVPETWLGAAAWILAPIASELPDEWATLPGSTACVAFGWQGILRNLEAGARVTKAHPGPSPLLARADIVGVSRHDIPGELQLGDIGAWLAPRADLLLTAGTLGGMLVTYEAGRFARARCFPAILAGEELDPVGAGDTILAGVVAARIVLGPDAPRLGQDVRVGAAAASVLVEAPGLDSVPSFGALRDRARSRRSTTS